MSLQFTVGDKVICTNEVNFIDGTQHKIGFISTVDERSKAYFNANQKDYKLLDSVLPFKSGIRIGSIVRCNGLNYIVLNISLDQLGVPLIYTKYGSLDTHDEVMFMSQIIRVSEISEVLS